MSVTSPHHPHNSFLYVTFPFLIGSDPDWPQYFKWGLLSPSYQCTTKILPFLKIPLPDISQNHINPFQGNVIFQQKGKENGRQKRKMLKRKNESILRNNRQFWREKKKPQLPCKRKDIISFVEKVIQRNNGKSESWGKAHLYKITAR